MRALGCEPKTHDFVNDNPDTSFSVLTVTYNRGATLLPETVNSILRQKYVGAASFAYEHIIVDNGSTDETSTFLQELEESYPESIKVVTLDENVPEGEALNLALELAEGDFVWPLCDDDTLKRLGMQVFANAIGQRQMECRPQIGFMFGFADIIDQDGRLIDDQIIDYDQYKWSWQRKEFFEILWHDNHIVPGTTIMSREAMIQLNGWLSLASNDWAVALELIAADIEFDICPNYVSNFRCHPDQLSAIHSVDGTWQKDGELIRRQMLSKYAGREALYYIEKSPEIYQTVNFLGISSNTMG